MALHDSSLFIHSKVLLAQLHVIRCIYGYVEPKLQKRKLLDSLAIFKKNYIKGGHAFSTIRERDAMPGSNICYVLACKLCVTTTHERVFVKLIALVLYYTMLNEFLCE